MPTSARIEHERETERILELLEREVLPFADLSDAATQARRTLPLVDPAAPTDWCRTYLPHYFDRPFSRAHQRMVNAAGEQAMPTFIAAFRGFGKSVLLSMARPLHALVSGAVPFLIYGAQVQGLAARLADFVRVELEHNRRIACDYGEVRVEGPEEEWTVDLGRRHGKGKGPRRRARVETFGIGMSPRGRRFRQHRPWEFIGDDLETAELARNPRREQQLWDWLYDEVHPGLDRDHAVLTCVGTMFGPGCMMQRAEAEAKKVDPDGLPLARFLRIPAMQNGHSVWPDGASDRQLRRLRAQHGLRNWNRNYALVCEDPTKPFQAAWIGEYDEADLDRSKLDIVAFLDPAFSESASGCPRALIVVGANRKTGLRYVLDAWITRGTPMSMVDKIIETNDRWHPRLTGVEANGGYALIQPLLRMSARGFVPVRYVTHTQPKPIRIERLSPQFEAGRWLFPHNPGPGVRVLQEQLLSYPQGFVDGPDALAGCGELLPDAFAPASGAAEYHSLSKRRQLGALV